MDAFFDEIAFDPVKLFIVGCGCSVASEPVAEISHRWNISQVINYKEVAYSEIFVSAQLFKHWYLNLKPSLEEGHMYHTKHQ